MRAARRDPVALLRRAYRRPVTDGRPRRADEVLSAGPTLVRADFDAGIEMALAAVLVNPQFLFRVEQDPPGVAPNTAYRVSDLDLASRLSFFLWSSIPDDELLDLAVRERASTSRRCSRNRCGACWRTTGREPGDQLRRAVAAPAQPGIDHARTCACSRTSTTTCARRSGRKRSCSFESVAARGPQRARPAQGGLHVPQRAPRQALRHPARLRQPLPPRRARTTTAAARRPAAPGEHPDRHLLRDAHLAGDPRQVDPRELPRHAAAAAAGQRAGAEGQHRRRRASPIRERLAEHRANAACAAATA